MVCIWYVQLVSWSTRWCFVPEGTEANSACVKMQLCVYGYKEQGMFEGLEEKSRRVWYVLSRLWHVFFLLLNLSIVQICHLLVFFSQGTPARWRDFHSATIIGTKMFVFGGRADRFGPFHSNNEIYCNKIKVFDTETNCWLTTPSTQISPEGRRSHSACETQIQHQQHQ